MLRLSKGPWSDWHQFQPVGAAFCSMWKSLGLPAACRFRACYGNWFLLKPKWISHRARKRTTTESNHKLAGTYAALAWARTQILQIDSQAFVSVFIYVRLVLIDIEHARLITQSQFDWVHLRAASVPSCRFQFQFAISPFCLSFISYDFALPQFVIENLMNSHWVIAKVVSSSSSSSSDAVLVPIESSWAESSNFSSYQYSTWCLLLTIFAKRTGSFDICVLWMLLNWDYFITA